MTSDDLGFKFKFYEGFLDSIHKRAVSTEHTYPVDFRSVLAWVQHKLVLHRTVKGRVKRAPSAQELVEAA